MKKDNIQAGFLMRNTFECIGNSNKGNSMRFFLMILLCSFLLLGCKESNAQNATKKPYNATTVDECIEEKECVWNAFFNQFYQTIPFKSTTAKWNTEIEFYLRGDSVRQYYHDVISTIDQIEQLIPISIVANPKEPSFLMSITTDYKKELDEHRKNFPNNMNHDWVVEGLKNKSYQCTSIVFIDPEEDDINAVVSFIDARKENVSFCILSEFYRALGLKGYDENVEFSVFQSKENHNPKLTKLDLFVLFIYYQPEFQSGDSYEQIEKIYNKNFEKFKRDFKNI